MILLMELDNFTKHLQIFDMKQLLNFDITLSWEQKNIMFKKYYYIYFLNRYVEVFKNINFTNWTN